MATQLFGAVAPEFFGGFGASLFQVMTVEDWPEIARGVLVQALRAVTGAP